MSSYYNEHDKNAAAWLRELIKEGVITDGEVDERSIEDVLPADLAGFERCHFFAGIGVWDYALNLSGFTGPVWTGSCPCQPFSAAGKGEGFADERHLWPAWFHLIEVCRPHTIFGEQVASKDGSTWLDLVHSDLEGIAYTIGTVDIPAAGVGAPHIRQRLFFVADSPHQRTKRKPRNENRAIERTWIRPQFLDVGNGGESRVVADAASDGCEERHAGVVGAIGGSEQGWVLKPSGTRSPSIVGNAKGSHGEISIQQRRPQQESSQSRGDGRPSKLDDTNRRRREQLNESEWDIQELDAGCANGFWSDAEWIYCRDEKYRPTKPGIFPLADGTPGRVALLRGAGNAISPWVAQAFIESYLET